MSNKNKIAYQGTMSKSDYFILASLTEALKYDESHDLLARVAQIHVNLNPGPQFWSLQSTDQLAPVLDRISHLPDVTNDTKNRASVLLRSWRMAYESASCGGFPRPWTFSSPEGHIEFEWETSLGSLDITLHPNGTITHVLFNCDAEEPQSHGSLETDDAVAMLFQLAG